MVICAVANTIMSIIKKNNGERDRKASFSRNNGSGSTSATVSIMIIALTLLAGGFLILSPITAMTITTAALAQEEGGGNNSSTTGGTITTTTSDDITNTATTNTAAAAAAAATRPSSSVIHLSAQPIWQESTANTGVTPFDQTHSIVTFFGNGTFTVPDTGETINATNNGTALMSSVTGSGYGRASFFSEEDSDSTAITFYEIKKSDPGTSQTKGITIAVFDNNATGSLRPFNGMIVVGLHDEQPNAGVGTRTLWMWESEIGNSTGVDAHLSP
jgi:hypothetical protein